MLKIQDLLNEFGACEPGMEWVSDMSIEDAIEAFDNLMQYDRPLAIKFGLWLVDKFEKTHAITHDSHIKKTVKPGREADIYYEHMKEKIIKKLKELDENIG